MKRYGLLLVDDEKEILRTLTLTFKDDLVIRLKPVGALLATGLPAGLWFALTC
jgi:hypothetical protein